MKIGIIGGGASGMILASKLKDCDVTIIERNNKLGKKLLLTGNGKCNFTNLNFENLNDIYNNSFAINLYRKYDNISFIKFFNDIGIVPKIEVHKGIRYVYPNSNKATSVYYCLLDKILANNVNIVFNAIIKDIEYKNKVFHLLDANGNSFDYDIIVLSTGGISYSNTGSDGIGYKLANKFGHDIISTLPGLVSLQYCFSDNNINMVNKCRVNATVNFKYDDETVYKEHGEIQFNEDTISGIPILNLSSKIVKYLSYSNNIIFSVDFSYELISANNSLPDVNNNNINLTYDERFREVKNILISRKNKTKYRNLKNFMCGFLPDEISEVILRLSGVYKYKLEDLSDNLIDKIVDNIINLKIKVKNTSGFNSAQITIGGVNTAQVDNDTLESKLQKGLYFTGEILDIDGICGGYNLQLAYSSASIVANSILEVKNEH